MTFQTPMNMPGAGEAPETSPGMMTCYLDSLSLVERLHRLLLDVIKDEFERLGILEINPVQALLLFNVGENEVTAGELKTRGYYQGSNVSYNLKKLVEAGYIFQERSRTDRRSVRIKLTPKGEEVANSIQERHAVLTELFRLMGLSPEEFYADIEGIEHHISDAALPGFRQLAKHLQKFPMNGDRPPRGEKG